MPLHQLRVVVVVGSVVAALAAATVTFAASGVGTSPSLSTQPLAKKRPLVVPDVRGQVYVFAKGTLEDAGFGFRVQGPVPGYAANAVASQNPAPGTKIVDTGAPTVTLILAGSSRAAHGVPENAAPYPSTALKLYRRPKPAVLTTTKLPLRTPTPSAAKVAPTRPAMKRAARLRPPAFIVPGAPREPVDQISLTERAQRLDRWLTSHPVSTPANLRYWLYQHSWIVTGATLGWWHGAEALQLLIAADRRAQSQWGVGALSLRQAQAALAQVQSRMRSS